MDNHRRKHTGRGCAMVSDIADSGDAWGSGAVSVWTFIFSWAIAAGYKDWLMDRRKREKLVGLLDQENWA